MDFWRHFVHALGLLPVVFCGGLVEAASASCVDNASIEKTTLGPALAKHYYMVCTVVADSKHPFLARVSAERRAAATERLKDKTAQTLVCAANPRDPARSGLQKKEMIVLTSCNPARVGEVWQLP